MEQWAHPASQGELPPRRRPCHLHCPRSNASRTRSPCRGAQRQLHQGRRFSAPMRTWPVAASSLAGDAAEAHRISSSATTTAATAPRVNRRTSPRAGRRATSALEVATYRVRVHTNGNLWQRALGVEVIGHAARTSTALVNARLTRRSPLDHRWLGSRGAHPQQLRRLDLQHRGEPGDDLQPRIAGALLQLAQIGAVDATARGCLILSRQPLGAGPTGRVPSARRSGIG